jgi:hydrogenase expression/formation protein HypC
MCLAIPMRLVDCREWTATAELDGVRREIGLALCPEARTGDFVLVHAGYAIGRIDEDEAATTLALLAQISREEPS